jgi:CubicO group peptidase (beta-lactamase class C family)
MVDGTVQRGFERVREEFAKAQALDEGAAQLAVYLRGRLVVDLWTGGDRGTGPPCDGESVSILMSATKGLTATCAHLLSRRGELDLDAPVAAYWPEFAAGGKDRITVADLLAHRAGLFAFGPRAAIGAAELRSPRRVAAALAVMEPLWEPGSAFAYHALTFGFLVGEVVWRATGRTIGEVFAAEVADPLGLSLWIGLPASVESRYLPHFDRRPPVDVDAFGAVLAAVGVEVTAPVVQAYLGSLAAIAAAIGMTGTREGRAAENPSGNGVGNARSLAKMYAATIGEVDGVRLLDAAAVDRARLARTDAITAPPPLDLVPTPHPMRFGLGYELDRSAVPMLGGGSFGHAGAGGRLGYAHPESGVAVGYTCTNSLWDHTSGPDTRWNGWTEALRAAVVQT